jgi:Leucine-rich repeat (LRR) protein
MQNVDAGFFSITNFQSIVKNLNSQVTLESAGKGCAIYAIGVATLLAVAGLSGGVILAEAMIAPIVLATAGLLILAGSVATFLSCTEIFLDYMNAGGQEIGDDPLKKGKSTPTEDPTKIVNNPFENFKKFGLPLSMEGDCICIEINEAGMDNLSACLELLKTTFPDKTPSLSYSSAAQVSDEFLSAKGANIGKLDLGNDITDEILEKLIKFCPNVTSISLSSDLVSDQGLNNLKNLQFLTSLKLSGCNSLKDFGGLKYIKSLKELKLKNLNNLTSLNLEDCHFKCISLKNLPLLTELNLSNTYLTNLEGVSNLPLLKNLKVQSCMYLESTQGLNNLPALETFSCARSFSLRTVEDLSSLPKLIKLDFTDCRNLENVDGINNLFFLSELKFSECGLESFSGQRNLPSIKDISFAECRKLKDISGISNLTSITNLDFTTCLALTSVEAIANLPELTILNLSFCRTLTSLKGLSNLPKLAFLNLRTCVRLSSIEGLDQFRSLTSLDLSGCQALNNYENLAALASLTILYLEETNNLKEIDFLNNLTKLESFYFSGGKVTKINLNKLFNLKNLRIENCHSLVEVQLANLNKVELIGLSDNHKLNNIVFENVLLDNVRVFKLISCYKLDEACKLNIFKLWVKGNPKIAFKNVMNFEIKDYQSLGDFYIEKQEGRPSVIELNQSISNLHCFVLGLEEDAQKNLMRLREYNNKFLWRQYNPYINIIESLDQDENINIQKEAIKWLAEVFFTVRMYLTSEQSQSLSKNIIPIITLITQCEEDDDISGIVQNPTLNAITNALQIQGG